MTVLPVTVEIEIGDLVLDGFDVADGYKVSESITTELTRLVTESWGSSGGTPAHLSHGFELARLDAGSFQVAQDASPQKVGAQVAASLWESMAHLEGVTRDEKTSLVHRYGVI